MTRTFNGNALSTESITKEIIESVMTDGASPKEILGQLDSCGIEWNLTEKGVLSDDPTPSGWTRQWKSGRTLSPAYWLAVRRSILRLFHQRTLFFPFSLRELSILDTE